jgi:SAM-dependent methyltransferase
MSHFSAVDGSPDPSTLLASLERSAVGLGAMKRYVAYRLALLAAGGRVLDLGCGSGHDLGLVADAGCEPVGIDPSAVMLGAAADRHPGVPLTAGVGESLPFRDESFDGCRVERVLMHAGDPAVVLAEAHRVLRRGGFVAVFEPDWSTLWIESLIAAADDLAGRLSRCRWPDVGGRLTRLVEDAGFEVVDEVTESSRSGRLAYAPFELDKLLARAVDEGRVDPTLATAWLAEQRTRDADGRFRARWTKRLVVAWRHGGGRSS